MEPMEDLEEGEFDEEVNEEEDEEEDDSDADSEVIDPPYMARVPAHRMGPNGPMPPWAHDIWRWRWSRHQGQYPPFGMEQRFYDLSHGEPAD